MALPDFFLVGAPKAGSTALHVGLSRHPQLFLAAVKEPKFFLTDGPPPTKGGPGDARTYRQHVWRREDYEALFDPAPPGTRKGESMTLYLGHPEAHRRIAAAVPDARLIAVLRDPVDRAHSNWTHLFSAGLEPERDFLAACRLEPERLARGWAPFWGYTKLGRYGEQLSSLFQHFARDQVLVLTYRELRDHPVATLDRVCRHLGVDTGVLTEIPAVNLTAAASSSWLNGMLGHGLRLGSTLSDRLAGLIPSGVRERVSGPAVRLLQREQQRRLPLTVEQHVALAPSFETDIAVLERVLGRSFAHWRDPGNATVRSPLAVAGQFGTGFFSIDRPTAG
jgi:hypothetical protein